MQPRLLEVFLIGPVSNDIERLLQSLNAAEISNITIKLCDTAKIVLGIDASRSQIIISAGIPIELAATEFRAFHKYFRTPILAIGHEEGLGESYLNFGADEYLPLTGLDRWTLARTIHRLQRLHEMREQFQSFVYSVSHDFSEPARSISSFLDLLVDTEGEQLSETGMTFIGFCTDATTRLKMMLKSLLIFSRVESRPKTSA